jgi:hypothetical protein
MHMSIDVCVYHKKKYVENKAKEKNVSAMIIIMRVYRR